ncbi:MAG TPA: DciA family protein [Candidatus Omnitrophota bacterium]|nr:DciA family protein [Candidatus Omnitrophota bacterium]HQQ05793.1 DciA family protein [Candidatus Omnitrophota bacterium]
MDDIRTTIAAVLKDLETRKTKTAASDPAQYFAKVFAKKELRHVRLAYFRNGICAIAVDSAPWMYHLNLRKRDLLAKLREYSMDVKDIRFVIGEIKVAKTK